MPNQLLSPIHAPKKPIKVVKLWKIRVHAVHLLLWEVNIILIEVALILALIDKLIHILRGGGL